MRISGNSMANYIGGKLTYSQGDSLASLLVLPGSDAAQQMTATSGRKCLELLEKFSPAGSLARTFTALLLGTTAWYSGRCYLIWKLKATKLQDMYRQLQVSTPRISETEYGSLLVMPPLGVRKLIPTPVALDGKSESLAGMLRKNETPENTSTLTAYVRHNWHRLVPTPVAMDATNATAKMRSSQVKKGSMHSVTLSRWVAMLPTPTARDWKGGRSLSGLQRAGRKPTNSLPDFINSDHGKTGQLNPRFVAEMMGFPIDWTELPFRSGEPNP